THIGILILFLLGYNEKLQGDKIEPLHRELMVQDAVDPLSAETLLAEMFRQDRRGHLPEIAHFVYRDTAADHFLHIGICDVVYGPYFPTVFFLLVPLIHIRDYFFRFREQADEFPEGHTLLGHGIVGSGFEIG